MVLLADGVQQEHTEEELDFHQLEIRIHHHTPQLSLGFKHIMDTVKLMDYQQIAPVTAAKNHLKLDIMD